MSRKTPPVAKQVVPPRLTSSARFQARLIDFDTGSHLLEEQHKHWLRTSMLTAAANSMYRIRLVGYASKLGDSAMNSNLSYARIDTALKYMQSVDRKAMARAETFRAVGEDGYSAAETDNSADWRAVETHIFIGDIPPPPPPPDHTPTPVTPPLPGGPRFSEWEIVSPGGAIVTAPLGGGFNIFCIKNPKLNEMRGYIQPVGAVGGSFSVEGLKKAWNIIQQILTGVQYTNMDFTAVTAKLPVTWKEMEDCLVRVTSIGGGVVVVGASYAIVTFTAAGVWQYSPSGFPVKLPGGVLFQFEAKAKSWQLGVGGSVAVGPLVRVDA